LEVLSSWPVSTELTVGTAQIGQGVGLRGRVTVAARSMVSVTVHDQSIGEVATRDEIA
jgi:hypothetical protein